MPARTGDVCRRVCGAEHAFIVTAEGSVAEKGVLWGLVALVGVVVVPVLAIAIFVGSQNNKPDVNTGGLTCNPGETPSGQVAGYGPDQLRVATGIVAAADEMQLPDQAKVIGVATAIQESSLTQVNHGDVAGPDSLGPFQQRNSWGPPEQRMDPKGSARLFFQRLITKDWTHLSLTQAAQAVQSSADGSLYQRHEQSARQVVGAVEGKACPARAGPASPNPYGPAVTARALSQVGVPYVWAGGNAQGPTAGRGTPPGVVGYDCSGLAQFAYGGVGVQVPHQTGEIWAHGGVQIRDRAQIQPGDLIMLAPGHNEGQIHHVGIYLGHDSVIDAPTEGKSVAVIDDVWHTWYSDEYVGAIRPGAVSTPQS